MPPYRGQAAPRDEANSRFFSSRSGRFDEFVNERAELNLSTPATITRLVQAFVAVAVAPEEIESVAVEWMNASISADGPMC
jgi:hypothetical protein